MAKEMDVKNLVVNDEVFKKNKGKKFIAITALIATMVGAGTGFVVYNKVDYNNSIKNLSEVPLAYTMSQTNNDYLETSTINANSYINGRQFSYTDSSEHFIELFNDYVSLLDMADEMGFGRLDNQNTYYVEEAGGLLDKYLVDGELNCDLIRQVASENPTEFEMLIPFIRSAAFGSYDEYARVVKNIAKNSIIDYINNKFGTNYEAKDINFRYTDDSSQGTRSYFVEDGKTSYFLGDNLDYEIRVMFEDVNTLSSNPQTLSELHEKKAVANRLTALSVNIDQLLNDNGKKLNVNNNKLRNANNELIEGYYESIGESSKGKSK